MSDPKACWECHKRRLICDFGSPACQKCEARGVACPGYGEKKPLKWLQPGQTRSKGKRARKEVNVIRLTLKDPSEATSVFEAIEYCEYPTWLSLGSLYLESTSILMY
jgi:hypothetical protein